MFKANSPWLYLSLVACLMIVAFVLGKISPTEPMTITKKDLEKNCNREIGCMVTIINAGYTVID